MSYANARLTAPGRRLLVRLAALVLLFAPVTVTTTVPTAAQAASTTYLSAHPSRIDFGKKHVGDTYYKRTKITNVSDQPVRLLVSAGLLDDFGFGLQPGSTCPVLDGGAVLAPRESCYAVVRFTPTEFFAGWLAEGELVADAYDPTTGVLLEQRFIRVTGMAVL